MTKLQKLSREQQKILDDLCKESREEILSYKYIEYDEDIRKDIEWLYDISGIKDKPFILFFDSYYESQLASNYGALINVLTNGKKIRGNQVGNQVWNQVRNQVRNQVGNQVWNQVGNQVENQVWNQVGNQVENQVWNQMGNQVENQVWNQVGNQVRNQMRNQVRNQVGNQVWNQVRNQVENQVWNQVGNQVRKQVRNQVENQVGNQVGNQVWDQVENQVWNQVGNQVWNQVGNQVRNQVWNQVGNQVWNQVGNQVGNQVRNQMGNQVENQVWNQVWNQVRNQVRNQVWKEKLVFFNQYFGLFYESYWLTFYEFFTRTNMINNKDFERWRNILRKGIYSIIFLDNFCIITRVPKTIKLSDRGLHSTSGKALEWINGDGYYFIHGVKFDFELWDKIVKRKITVREVLKITNADQRYIALQYYGPEKLMEELDTKLIDVWKNPRTNTEIELYELSNIIENRKLKLLKYTDPSINKTRIAFTQDDQISALESISLKHNMTFEEYEGIIQES